MEPTKWARILFFMKAISTRRVSGFSNGSSRASFSASISLDEVQPEANGIVFDRFVSLQLDELYLRRLAIDEAIAALDRLQHIS
jgi:hypothetical protein